MQFSVNEGIVKMLEIISKSASLWWLFVVLVFLWRLPDIIRAIRWW